MPSSSFALSFFLSCTLLIQIVISIDPLVHICSSFDNSTSNYSPYQTNLNKLLAHLTVKTPPTGFGLGSVNLQNDAVYGLSLCRGDVSITDCKGCIAEASDELLNRCPNNKAAIIWYDNCLLKYSDSNFFGEIDSQNKFYLFNVNNVSEPELFNKKTKELLSDLSEKAYAVPKMYAAGELDVGESKKLYGLVQCTRDLSYGDCKKCLDDAISELPSCCDGKEGGRVVGGSCNIRYEIFSFVSNA